MKAQVEQLLSSIASDLHLLNNDYFVIGSGAMILLNVPVRETFDLDLFVSDDDANILASAWKDRRRNDFAPADSSRFKSNFARYDFGAMDIEVMGHLQVFKNEVWQHLHIEDFIEITIAHLKIKVPTLQEQHRILHLFGRPKDLQKAKLIESYW